MQPVRSRWRSGARAALYLIAFGIVAGGALIAVGVLLLLFAGVIVGGGIMALFFILGLLSLLRKQDNRESASR